MTFFYHVLHHFGIVFAGKAIENDFMYSGTCWTPWWAATSRARRSLSSSWWSYFLSYYTSFRPSFLTVNWLPTNDCKWFQVPQEHVGYHSGRRHQGQGGVHQVVDEIILHHVLHCFSIVFDEELIENYFKYLRDKLDTMMDIYIKDKEEWKWDLMDTMNANYSEGNFKRKYFFNGLH